MPHRRTITPPPPTLKMPTRNPKILPRLLSRFHTLSSAARHPNAQIHSARIHANPRKTFFTNNLHSTRRHASTARPHAQPTMAQLQALHAKKNQTTINYGLSVVIGFIALSYASVPLYRLLCSQTGFGGQPVRSSHPTTDPTLSSRLIPQTDVPRLRITFRGSTSDTLPWKFTPQQREVRIHPGETALAFYKALNKSSDDIIGVATYSVAPGEVAPYFSKIQCFCFEEQRLNAGEEVDMPVFFYIDRAFLEDPNMRGIQDITLNYTFFKAKYDKEGHLRPVAAS